MNFTESFQEFSSRLTTTDLMVYGGAGLVIFILFKDKLSPFTSTVYKLYEQLISKIKPTVSPVVTVVSNNAVASNNDNAFIELIHNWKTTRDCAQKMGCSKAVEVLDTVFPYLSPNTCQSDGGAK